MNNKLFTPGEILTIQTNLNEIEKTLGHSIPGGMVDVSELKDHILRPGEVVTVCRNLSAVSKPAKRTVYSRVPATNLETTIVLVALAIGAICVFFDFAFGIDLLWWTY